MRAFIYVAIVALQIAAGTTVVATSALAGGNLSVTVRRGNLLVKGDDAASFITLGCDDSPVPGEILVHNPGGTINGSSLPFLAVGVAGKVVVQLGDGDDDLEVGDQPSLLPCAPLPSDLRITAGKGNQGIAIHDSSVAGNLSISADAGDRDIEFQSVTVYGDLTIRTGSGKDSIHYRDDSSVLGDLKINTGAGDDMVDCESGVGGVLQINTGAGDDSVELRSTLSDKNFLFAGPVTVMTGGGRDDVDISGSICQSRVRVILGADGDSLRVGETTFHAGVTFDGGGRGVDSYFDESLNYIGAGFALKNFEEILPATCGGGITTLRFVNQPGSAADLDIGWTGLDRDARIPAAAEWQVAVSCASGECTGSGAIADGHTPFGGPFAVSAGNVGFCVVDQLREPITGTHECGSGCTALTVRARWHVYQALDPAKPCPVCVGDPVPNDGLKQGTCDGGSASGASCDVNGIAPPFGSTSRDCLPAGSSIGELDVDLAPLTSRATTLAANVNCLSTSFPPGSCSCPGQVQPNLCLSGICSASGVCEEGPMKSTCSGQPFRTCRAELGTGDCEDAFPGAGTCVTTPMPCFGTTIRRNGQCGSEAGVLASVFCLVGTGAPAVNTVAGLPGPAALTVPYTLERIP